MCSKVQYESLIQDETRESECRNDIKRRVRRVGKRYMLGRMDSIQGHGDLRCG